MPTCYRHPDRETGVRCSNCNRPICPDCMSYAAVGVRCPECSGQRSRVRAAGFHMARTPYLTWALIFANVAAFLATNKIGGGGGLFGGGSVNSLGYDMTVYAGAVADGEYYRLLSSAFVHFGPLHLAFNMYALYLLGGALESYAGSFRFGAIYFISALTGSLGALLLSPDARTGGASGAIFGVMGALFVLERQRGISLLGGPIGGLLLFNLLFTLAVPGISVGGHLGGLAGGVLCGLILSGFGRGHLAYGRISPLAVAALVALAVGTVAASVAVA
jgi:membrane associated rhomboid family serine protease